MTTAYTDYEHNYYFQAINGPTQGQLLAVQVTGLNGNLAGWTESDLSTAIQAFTDSLNNSATVSIDKVDKSTLASGTSDWTYEPTV